MTEQEDDRLAEALSRGATDYVMVTHVDQEVEEWITEWIMQIP